MLAIYFVRKGVKFDDGSPSRMGFDSDIEISVYIKDKEGQIILSGSDVNFYYPGITGVNINGSLASVIDSGTGWVKINIEPGMHDLQFISNFLKLF